MIKFYLFPNDLITLLIMMMAGTIVVQTIGATYGFRRLKYHARPQLENIMELTLLFQLIVQEMLLAEAAYHAKCEYVYSSGYVILRYGLFFMLTIMSMMLSWRKRIFWPLAVPLAVSLTLPVIEQMSGGAYPILFISTIVFWQIRCIHILMLRRQEQHHELSVLSVKEAVDTLDSGMLFYQKQGQVLLQNSRMQDLMLTLTGQFQYDGKIFYEALRDGKVQPDCRKGEMGEQLAYWLPDGTIWVFDRHVLTVRNSECILMVATDTTERWKATHQLWQQNQELERINQELKKMMENMGTICRTEVMIHAKSRVHDVLGQRISLLLRAMREHREPDEVLLSSFAEGLPADLTEFSGADIYSLDTLVEAFKGLGVTIDVQGELPQEETLSRTFFEIAAEAVTNSVRHGYASEVRIVVNHEDTAWKMNITDTGIPPAGKISEGGGLKGMRRKAEELGGTFSYDTAPDFRIKVEIPEGEAI